MADVIRFNLERSGFSVTVAYDGRRAIEQLQQERFDLIVTDYQMPDANGADLCRHARQDERHANIPIFLCSAKGFELDLDRLTKEFEIAKVYIKPFSPREIVQDARALLEDAAVSP
jgi:CheY-like chemotaxis protein